MKPISYFDRCPHYGSDEGYYTKERARGTIHFFHNYDGSEAENGNMYSSVSGVAGTGVWTYCATCYKKIARMEEKE